jgi:DNA-binding phage protein
VSEEKSARELVEELRDDLTKWGLERTIASQNSNYAMHKIGELVLQGRGVLSVTEMARLSGVSRDTIYQILKESR